jgi:hypothetical protein
MTLTAREVLPSVLVDWQQVVQDEQEGIEVDQDPAHQHQLVGSHVETPHEGYIALHLQYSIRVIKTQRRMLYCSVTYIIIQ